MMKYYDAQGNEVIPGSTGTLLKLGSPSKLSPVVFTPEVMDLAVKMGLLVEKEVVELPEKEIPLDLVFYIRLLEEQMEWEPQDGFRYIETLMRVYPVTAFNTLLRVIAEHIDETYPDHIKNSDKIFVVSTLSGKVVQIDKSKIKSYSNFAAFRSVEDAGIACRILRDLKREIFK